jgi:hypothetical protein
LYEAIIDEYLDIGYTKYQMDLRRIGKTNWLNNVIMKLGGWEGKKRSHKGVWAVTIIYLLIILYLLVFVGIY